MFHAHAHPEAVRLVEQNPDLKLFIKELNHKFGVSVMSYDRERHNNLTENNPGLTPPERLRLEHSISVMVVKPDGTPFCVASVGEGANKNGDKMTEYNVMASFIEKDRGRGGDKHYRSSINLKALIKLLEKDFKHNNKSVFSEYIPLLLNFAENSAREEKDIRYRGGLRMSDSTLIELLRNKFEKEELSQKTIDEMDKAYKLYMKAEAAEVEVQEMVNRLCTEVYMLVQYKHCPASVAKVTIKQEGVGDKQTKIVSVHPDVKCFSTMNELAAEYPDLAVSMKMFNTKHNLESKQNSMYEISNHKFGRKDKYDSDLDFINYYATFSDYGGFNKVDIIMVPVTKYE